MEQKMYMLQKGIVYWIGHSVAMHKEFEKQVIQMRHKNGLFKKWTIKISYIDGLSTESIIWILQKAVR